MIKNTLIILSAILITGLILIGFLPTIVSTQWGKEQFFHIINKQIPGKIKSERLSLTWFGPQIIEKGELSDPHGRDVAHFDRLTTDGSLFSLILHKGMEQNIELANFDLSLHEESNGSTNLHDALGLVAPYQNQVNSNRTQPLLALELTDLYAKVSIKNNQQPVQISLNGKTKQNAINGDFTIDLLLKQTFIDDDLILNPIQLGANIFQFPVAIIDHFISLTHPELTGAISKLIGDTINLSLKQKDVGSGFSFELAAKTPLSSMQIDGMVENGRIQLIKPSTISLQAPTSTLVLLNEYFKDKIPFEITQPTLFTLNLDKIDFSLKFLNNKIVLDENPAPLIQGNLNIAPTVIETAALPTPLNVELNLQFNGILLGEMKTKLLGTITPQDNQVLSYLGSAANIDVDAYVNLQKDSKWMINPFAAQITSRLLSTELKGSLDANQQLDLFHPIEIHYKLTPENLAFLELNKKGITINPTPLNIKLHSFDFHQKHISAECSIPQVYFQQERKQGIFFENVVAFIESQNIMTTVNFKLHADERIQGNRYPISLKGEVKDYLGQNGSIDFSNLRLNLEMKSPRLPASLICQISTLDCSIRQKVEALFGETINTDVKIDIEKMEGLLSANLVGKNGKIEIEAQINENNITLLRPFTAEFLVTPELEKSVIQDIFPVLNGVIRADQPIKITVDSLGFSLPLKQTELDKVAIESATLELGKMYFSGTGTLGTVFDLLGASNRHELSVQFTPLYFSINRGTIKLSRMDMLLMGEYPMAIWGKVNPVKDRVDLRIGITGAALSHAFNISGLDPEYMMQFALTGTLANASIDKAKAVSRISALVAHSKGTPEATLIGAVIGFASGGFTEEAIPPPTTDPLPWDLTVKPKQEKKQAKSLVDDMEEAASNIIENLFK